MPWTGAAVTSQSWGTTGATTKTYSAGAVSTVAWGPARAQPAGTDGGIDFEYQLRNEGYFPVLDDRPLPLVSSLSEGSP